jgi:hypothetical protein
MVGRVPKVICFGNDDDNNDKSEDTAVIEVEITGGH